MASSDNGEYSSESDSFSPPINVLCTDYQLQRLEELFQECRLPNRRMREQWSIELAIEPDQIKQWFKSRLLQAQAEKENNALRSENARILIENLQMRARLTNGGTCSDCEQTPGLEELVRENVTLREEYQRLANLVADAKEDESTNLDRRSGPSSLSSSTDESSSEDEEDS